MSEKKPIWKPERFDGVHLADKCPGCGSSLFVGEGGWITCPLIGCKTIGLTDMIEAERNRLKEAFKMISCKSPNDILVVRKECSGDISTITATCGHPHLILLADDINDISFKSLEELRNYG